MNFNHYICFDFKNSTMENIFDAAVAQSYINRINALKPETQPKWGSMTADRMLAHCNVTYELVYEPQKHKKPNAFIGFVIKIMAKDMVTNDKPFKKNLGTGPQFKISDSRNFEHEKKRLIGFIQKTQQLGPAAFDGKASFSFGKLSTTQWNNMFAKHLNHHLEQFGV